MRVAGFLSLIFGCWRFSLGAYVCWKQDLFHSGDGFYGSVSFVRFLKDIIDLWRPEGRDTMKALSWP